MSRIRKGPGRICKDVWTMTPPSTTWIRTTRTTERTEVKEDLGETFEDVWTSMTDGCTKDQDGEADNEKCTRTTENRNATR